jgi:hypothetical protein
VKLDIPDLLDLQHSALGDIQVELNDIARELKRIADALDWMSSDGWVKLETQLMHIVAAIEKEKL